MPDNKEQYLIRMLGYFRGGFAMIEDTVENWYKVIFNLTDVEMHEILKDTHFSNSVRNMWDRIRERLNSTSTIKTSKYSVSSIKEIQLFVMNKNSECLHSVDGPIYFTKRISYFPEIITNISEDKDGESK